MMRIRKTIKILVYAFLGLLLVYDMLYMLPPGADHGAGDIALLVLFFVISGLICCQVNVLLYTGILFYGLTKRSHHFIFNPKLLLLFALNFVGIFTDSCLQIHRLLDDRTFDRVKCNNYGLNYNIVSKRSFLSDLYFIYSMGWNRICYYFNLEFKSGPQEQASNDNFYYLTFTNCFLSTTLLIIFCIVLTIRKKAT